MTKDISEYHKRIRRQQARDLTEEEFKRRLFVAGWSQEQIEEEWKRIQEDDESGYDGP